VRCHSGTNYMLESGPLLGPVKQLASGLTCQFHSWDQKSSWDSREHQESPRMRIKLSLGILFLTVASAAASAAAGLPFIHDDYPRALAKAKQRNVPLFVECWAPW
jgi:hypothetical protein